MEAQGIDGVHRLYAVAPIRGPSGDQVWLSIGRTPEVLYAAVTAVILRDLVAIGATLLAALAAIWIGSNRLVLRRADQLVDASTRLHGVTGRSALPSGHPPTNWTGWR